MAVGGSVIGALRVVLGADTATFETGLKSADKSLSAWATKTKATVAVAAAAVASAAMAVGVAVFNQMDKIDKMGKMAQSVGIPVEELSQLALAAELSDVSMESLSKALGRLNRNIFDAAAGSEQQVEAFRMLGIEARNADQTLKSVSQVLPQIAERFSKMPDGPEKTALAMKLLGRSGAELIPMLNQGAGGLNTMMQEARALGLVITNETFVASEQFNDNLKLMGKVSEGIINQIVVQMAPALANLSAVLLQAAKDEKFMAEAGDILAKTFKGLVTAGIIVGAVFKVLWSSVAAVAKAVMLVVKGEFSAAFDALKGGFEDYKTTIDGATKMAEGIWAEHGNTMATQATQLGHALNKPIVRNMKDLKELEKQQQKMAAEATKVWEQMHQEGNRVFEETRTPMEKYANELARLNDLFAAGHLAVDTYQRKLFQLQMQSTGLGDIMRSVGSSLESAWVGAITEGKKLGDVAKDLLKDFARLAAQTAFRAMFGGFFGGGGGMFNLPAFAGGGSFDVGGAGSIDSQLVAFKATPGEHVSITRQGEDVGGGFGTVIQNFNDFRNVDAQSRAFVENQIRRSEARSAARVPGLVQQHRGNNPDFLKGRH